ncbi:MAG: hypothetical protein KatS3mg054_0003 [Chloroflexus sp.]|nr:MAG: hypothetical protein KatS3mg054_0003 [Chloroflexus sp.]
MVCSIHRDFDGTITAVETPTGAPSRIYRKLVEYFTEHAAYARAIYRSMRQEGHLPGTHQIAEEVAARLTRQLNDRTDLVRDDSGEVRIMWYTPLSTSARGELDDMGVVLTEKALGAHSIPVVIKKASGRIRVVEGEDAITQARQEVVSDRDYDAYAVDTVEGRVYIVRQEALLSAIGMRAYYMTPDALSLFEQRRKGLQDSANDDIARNAIMLMAEQLAQRYNIEVVYDDTVPGRGMVKDGKVYINLSKATLDTPVHEFAHIFLEYVRHEAPQLYDSLRQAIREEMTYLERIKQNEAYGELSEEEQEMEALAQALGELGSEAYMRKGRMARSPLGKLIHRFKEFLKYIFEKIEEMLSWRRRSMDRSMRRRIELVMGRHWQKGDGIALLQDVAELVLNENSLLRPEVKGEYRQVDPNDEAGYNWAIYQRIRPTQKQIEVAEKLMEQNRKIQLDAGQTGYVVDGQVMRRVSDELKALGYAEEFRQTINSEYSLKWGNAIDSVVKALLLNQGVPSDPNISPHLMQKLYDEFKDLLDNNPNTLLIPQVTFWNDSRKVAGTADVVLVTPDGKIKIYDVKTSRYDFNAPGDMLDKKLKQYGAQTSMYAAMAAYQGYEVDVLDQTLLAILPVKLDVGGAGNSQYVLNAHRTPPIIYLPLNNNIFASYSTSGTKTSQVARTLAERILYALQEAHDTLMRNGRDQAAYEIRTVITLMKEEILKGGYIASLTYFSRLTGSYVNKYTPAMIGSLIQQLNMNNYGVISRQLYEIDKILELMQTAISQALLVVSNDMSGVHIHLQQLQATLQNHLMAFNQARSSITWNLPDKISKILAAHVNPKTKEAIRQQIDAMEKKVAWYEQRLKTKERAAQTEEKERRKEAARRGKIYEIGRQMQKYLSLKGRYEKLRGQLAQLKEKFVNPETNEIDLAYAINQELRNGMYLDVSDFDRYFSNATSMPAGWLAGYAMMLHDAYINLRATLMKWQQTAYDQVVKLEKATGVSRNNVNEFYKYMYTRSRMYFGGEMTEVMSFTVPIDYGAFEEDYSKAHQRAKQEAERTGRDFEEIFNEWYEQATIPRPAEHIEGLTYIIGADGKRIELIQTEGEIIEQIRQRYGDRYLQHWLRENPRVLRIPNPRRYANKNFEYLKRDRARWQMYTFLLAEYMEQQSVLPRRKIEHHKFILPFVRKSTNDRLFVEGKAVEWLKYETRDLWERMDHDYSVDNLSGEKSVPVMYWSYHNIVKADDVSLDLIQSIARFKFSAERYKISVEHEGVGNLLARIVETTPPRAEVETSVMMEDLVVKKLGSVTGLSRYRRKQGINNLLGMLHTFIDVNIYNITRTDEKLRIGSRIIDIGKIVNSILKFASMTQIMADPLVALANHINSQSMLFEEAFAARYFKAGTWAKAQAIFYAHAADRLADSLGAFDKSFFGMLMDAYDANIGDFYDEYGRRLSKTAVKARFDTSTLYSMMSSTEMAGNGILLVALLLEEKSPDGKGSMYDYVYRQWKKNKTIHVDKSVMHRHHALAHRLFGIYDQMSALEIQRHWLGRLITLYRKYLAPGLKRRFKQWGIDYEVGDTTDGFYRVALRTLWYETSEVVKAWNKRSSNLTPYEQYAVRLFVSEALLVIGTGLLAYALIHMVNYDDDDEEQMQWHEKYIRLLPLYAALRANAELSVYGMPGDINDNFMIDSKEVITPYITTSVAFSILQKFSKFMQLATTDIAHTLKGEDIERYERDYPPFEKGDSKTLAAFLKLNGISGKNLDMEIALKSLTLTKGVDYKKPDSDSNDDWE